MVYLSRPGLLVKPRPSTTLVREFGRQRTTRKTNWSQDKETPCGSSSPNTSLTSSPPPFASLPCLGVAPVHQEQGHYSSPKCITIAPCRTPTIYRISESDAVSVYHHLILKLATLTPPRCNPNKSPWQV